MNNELTEELTTCTIDERDFEQKKL